MNEIEIVLSKNMNAHSFRVKNLSNFAVNRLSFNQFRNLDL